MLCLMVFLPHFYLLTLYAFGDRQDNLRRNSTSSLTPHFRKIHSYRWIGTPVSRCTRQINSRKKQKGLQQIRDHVRKTLDEEIQIYCVYFCVIHFWPLIFQNMRKQGPNKNIHDRIGFSSSSPQVPRSQALLRCLGLFLEFFFSFF